MREKKFMDEIVAFRLVEVRGATDGSTWKCTAVGCLLSRLMWLTPLEFMNLKKCKNKCVCVRKEIHFSAANRGFAYTLKMRLFKTSWHNRVAFRCADSFPRSSSYRVFGHPVAWFPTSGSLQTRHGSPIINTPHSCTCSKYPVKVFRMYTRMYDDNWNDV